MLSVLAKLEWLVIPDVETCLDPSSNIPGLMALMESGVSLPFLVLVEFPLVTRYFNPRRPSPNDLWCRSFLNLSDNRGDGGGIIGEEGDLSFSVTVLLELGGSGCCVLMSGWSRIACTPGGIRKGLLCRSSRPAKACSELAETLSMYGEGSTGEGLKPWESKMGPLRRL